MKCTKIRGAIHCIASVDIERDLDLNSACIHLNRLDHIPVLFFVRLLRAAAAVSFQVSPSFANKLMLPLWTKSTRPIYRFWLLWSLLVELLEYCMRIFHSIPVNRCTIKRSLEQKSMKLISKINQASQLVYGTTLSTYCSTGDTWRIDLH